MNPADRPTSPIDLVRRLALNNAGIDYEEEAPPTQIPDLTNTLWEGVAPEILTSPVSILRLSKVEKTLLAGGLATVGEVME